MSARIWLGYNCHTISLNKEEEKKRTPALMLVVVTQQNVELLMQSHSLLVAYVMPQYGLDSCCLATTVYKWRTNA